MADAILQPPSPAQIRDELEETVIRDLLGPDGAVLADHAVERQQLGRGAERQQGWVADRPQLLHLQPAGHQSE